MVAPPRLEASRGAADTSRVRRLSRLPLWAAVLAAPLLCNLVALTVAAVGYYVFGWPWAPIAIVPIWVRFAGPLLALCDSYETSESRRAVAVTAGAFWLVGSLLMVFAAVGAVERLATT